MTITTATDLTLSNLNVPLFLATALTHMEDRLQTIGFVNRQIEVARGEWNKGDKIKLKKAATFVVERDVYANMAAIPATKIEDSELTIDQYITTGMKMSDIEEAITGQVAWDMHTQRIGYALAAEVEREVLELFINVPHTIQVALSAVNEDVLIDTNRIFQELGVPEDGPQLRRFAADSQVWKKFLKVAAFSQDQGAGLAGVQTQTTGMIPEKFGLTPYMSNMLTRVAAPTNAPTGGIETAAIATGAAVVSGGTKGSKTITLTYTGLASPVVFTPGMVVQIGVKASPAGTIADLSLPTDGKNYRNELYTVLSSGAVSGGNITITLTQPLRQAHATGNAWRRIIMAASDAAHWQMGGFYRDAFALAMVQLPGNRPGVNMFTASNPNSGLSLRARQVYDGLSLQNALIFDGWFGTRCLDPDKAVRVCVNPAA